MFRAHRAPGLKKALAFHAFYNKGLAETGIVGASILILHDNQVLDSVSSGLADLERNIPATTGPSTIGPRSRRP